MQQAHKPKSQPISSGTINAPAAPVKGPDIAVKSKPPKREGEDVIYYPKEGINSVL
jgi:hypothetical protein